MELHCQVQHYDWGKLGKDSIVAELLANGDPLAEIDPWKPYAELWMGTHPNGPSVIVERDIPLSDYIKENEDAIGPDVKKEFGVTIPFLLKVLSVRKALSIQAHPNKEHAEILHQQYPELYKDPNHKPELAIALTPFEALCGFRKLSEIKHFIQKIPELANVLSEQSVDNALMHDELKNHAGAVLKMLFESLMCCERATVARNLAALIQRLQNEDEATQESLQFSLLKRLHDDYPGDIGCWSIYLMNHIQLNPGEAIFLGPNVPHAYLSGDCIECMACSDNVVRAGLTPKHIDVETLVSMLDYTSRERDQLLFAPQLEDEHSCGWYPPIPDFAVIKIKVTGEESYNTRLRASPSIFVVTDGIGQVSDTESIPVTKGSVIFLKANRQLSIQSERGSHLELYQAICNVSR